MKEVIENYLSRLGKYRDFSFDPEISRGDLFRTFLPLLIKGVRGYFLKHTFKKASGLVLVGKSVSILYPNHIKVGKNFVVEDYVEIVALSKQGINCGDNVTIGAFSTIKPTNYYGRRIGEGLFIGNNSSIGRYCYIGCSGLIHVGNNVMMSPGVNLFAENHNYEDTTITMKEQGVTRKEIVIEDDCWIASGSTILAGVHIGRGSIIAAGSVVTHDVPPFSVMAGIPAKLIKNRIELASTAEQ
jgi:acetyltransferase-like isoleucine patch superfamily enzyme